MSMTLPEIATTPYSERFAGRKPRIFIGVVAFGSVSPEVLISWVLWSMQLGKRYADKFEIYFGVASRREQYRARNYLIQEAREMGADFLLMVDDDHIVSDCPDMLDHFYDLEKPIQTAIGMQRGKENVFPTVLHVDDSGHCEFYTFDELPVESSPVDASGGGCTWVDMWVFDFLDQPFWWPYPDKQARVTFIPDSKYGLDIHFCLRAKEILGLQTWLNTNVVLGHQINEHDIVRPQTKDAHRMGYKEFAARESFRDSYKQVADAICRHFEFDTVLDVGSAQGFLVDELIDRDKSVRGVELEREAQALMSDRAKCVIEIADATDGWRPHRTYDLVTCIEVAEHIKPERSDDLLDALVAGARDWIFFTADETPTRLHINARQHHWWVEAFRERGWTLDKERTAAIQRDLYGGACEWIRPNAMVFKRVENV